MKIVGVGCAPGLLTEEAIRAISSAVLIYGSDRAILLASPHIPDGCEVREITDYKLLNTLPDHAVVLSTGDPLLAGLGYLAGDIIPGISSLQMAVSRLHIPLARISVVIAHGRDHSRACDHVYEEVESGRTVFLITDPMFDISVLAGRLRDLAVAPDIALCEDLGYPEERITFGTPLEPPEIHSSLNAVLIGDLRRNV